MISKQEVIETLKQIGQQDVAIVLKQWKSKINTDYGWNGYFRKHYPDLYKLFWGENK